jgi:hypothetical protein
MDGEDCYFDPNLPNPVTELLKRQRLSHTEYEMDRIRRLRDTAAVETRELIDALLSLTQSLQARLEALERLVSNGSYPDALPASGRATPAPGGGSGYAVRSPSFR